MGGHLGRRRLAALMVIGAACLLAGCSEPPVRDAPFLILDYDVTYDGEGYGAGGHCVEAAFGEPYGHGAGDDQLWITHGAGRTIGDGPGLMVIPHPTRDWGFGSGAWATSLPARISFIDYSEGTSPWTNISATFDDDRWSSVTVDGTAVTLPHRWERSGEGWNVTAELRDGPRSYRTFDGSGCD